jgi:hypothetical protein
VGQNARGAGNSGYCGPPEGPEGSSTGGVSKVWSRRISQPESILLQAGSPRVRIALRRIQDSGSRDAFPLVQFPNLPLIVAFLASQASHLVAAPMQPYARSLAYLAMAVRAYEELSDGVNWFRRLLGLAYVVTIVLRVAHALPHR